MHVVKKDQEADHWCRLTNDKVFEKRHVATDWTRYAIATRTRRTTRAPSDVGPVTGRGLLRAGQRRRSDEPDSVTMNVRLVRLGWRARQAFNAGAVCPNAALFRQGKAIPAGHRRPAVGPPTSSAVLRSKSPHDGDTVILHDDDVVASLDLCGNQPVGRWVRISRR